MVFHKIDFRDACGDVTMSNDVKCVFCVSDVWQALQAVPCVCWVCW